MKMKLAKKFDVHVLGAGYVLAHVLAGVPKRASQNVQIMVLGRNGVAASEAAGVAAICPDACTIARLEVGRQRAGGIHWKRFRTGRSVFDFSVSGRPGQSDPARKTK